MSDEKFVCISQHKYEELIDIKSRCEVLLDMASINETISMKDMYIILGELEIAQDIKAKDEADYQKWLDKAENSNSEVNAE